MTMWLTPSDSIQLESARSCLTVVLNVRHSCLTRAPSWIRIHATSSSLPKSSAPQRGCTTSITTSTLATAWSPQSSKSKKRPLGSRRSGAPNHVETLHQGEAYDSLAYVDSMGCAQDSGSN